MSFSEKVQGRHQDRLALLYVRQSTLRQVEQNQESTRLQYALVERALQLGWGRGSESGRYRWRSRLLCLNTQL